MTRRLCIAYTLVSSVACSVAAAQSFVRANSSIPGAISNAAHALGDTPRFASATIKLVTARDQQNNVIYSYPDGRVFCAHCTLEFLVSLAFDVADWQITGSADWTSLPANTRYDINAIAPEGFDATPGHPGKSPLAENQRQMLVSLLIDRFQLEGHRVTRADTIYILRRGDQPLKLAPPLHPIESHWAGAARGGPLGTAPGIAGKNISMPELSTRISGAIKRQVVDQTGLAGSFDFEYPSSEPAASDPATALSDSLLAIGLKLSSASGPVEMLVIDHARPPA